MDFVNDMLLSAALDIRSELRNQLLENTPGLLYTKNNTNQRTLKCTVFQTVDVPPRIY